MALRFNLAVKLSSFLCCSAAQTLHEQNYSTCSLQALPVGFFKIHNPLMVHILGKKCGNVNCSILRIDSINTSVSDLYFVISPATSNTNECSNDSLCFAVML